MPQNPDDWKKDKIVCPDISEYPRFFLDRSGSVVNGDCYWITLRDGVDADWLLLMLAVANSSLVIRYYDAVNHNKLYSGRRRFMTQYVAGFPLPPLKSPCCKKIVQLVSSVIRVGKADRAAQQKIDRHVWQAFGFEQDSLEFEPA